jgi:hypothetical protein
MTVLATLTDTKGIIALAAAAIAVIALLCCLALLLSLRRMRRAQRLVLGEQGQEDVIAHAARLHEGFDSLQAYVDDVARRLDGRLGSVEEKLRRTIAHRSLIRYDAYNELSGHQSVSIALLDEDRSGIVLTSIHHRDQARVYAKQVIGGQGELELSPEEAEAVRVALSGESASTPTARVD